MAMRLAFSNRQKGERRSTVAADLPLDFAGKVVYLANRCSLADQSMKEQHSAIEQNKKSRVRNLLITSVWHSLFTPPVFERRNWSPWLGTVSFTIGQMVEGRKPNQLMRGQPNFAGSCETLFYSASLACLQLNVKWILPALNQRLLIHALIHSHRRQGYAESFVCAASNAHRCRKPRQYARRA